MKKSIFLLLIALINYSGFSQMIPEVTWTTSVERLSDTEYNLVSKATIPAGFHLCSQDVPDGGPIPTAFTYDDEGGAVKILGNTSEEEGHIVDDPVFEMEIKFFENNTVFKQKVDVSEGISTINAFVEFMICNDTQCSPPTEVDLEFKLLDKGSTTKGNSEITKNKSTLTEHKDNKSKSDKSLWGIFFIAFFLGLQHC